MIAVVIQGWQVAVVCAAYVVAAWLLQAHRVVPPRDWLVERIDELQIWIELDRWRIGERGIRQLDDLKKSLAKHWLFLSTSRVQAGWRQVHAIEDDHQLELPADRAVESLETAAASLKRVDDPRAPEMSGRLDAALAPEKAASGDAQSTKSNRKKTGKKQQRKAKKEAKRKAKKEAEAKATANNALLREAWILVHDLSDTEYENLASILARAVWLTTLTLVLVALLGLVFHREALFLLGAVGGLTSRLTRLLRHRPKGDDYGAGWSSLILSPAAGALFGWLGVLGVAALSAPPFDVLSHSWHSMWNPLPPTAGLFLAAAFGFSERLLERVLGRGESQLESSLTTTKSKAAVAGKGT